MKISFFVYSNFILALACLFGPLLPWLSYGVGSKTGLDMSHYSIYFIFFFGGLALIINIVKKMRSSPHMFFNIFNAILAFALFLVYSYQTLHLFYQKTVVGSLPTGLFGFTNVVASQIKIGYGIWVGLVASFIMTLLNYIPYKFSHKKNT